MVSTDVPCPGSNSKKVAPRFRRKHPASLVGFFSGFVGDDISYPVIFWDEISKAMGP